MTRQLTTIQEIKKLIPIPDADKIELAEVLGWKCVVKKSDFKAGDKIVYYEIDSFLPIEEQYNFLERYKKKHADGTEGYRIRTIRLKGQISQGLIMPLSVLKGKKYLEDKRECPVYDFKIGTNVSNLLNVKLYEMVMPANLKGLIEGSFPYFIPKTDEMRIQVLQPVLDKYKDREFVITEKIDGTSVTYFLNDNIFGVCSRNLELCENEVVYWKLARENKIEEVFRKYNFNIALQGEIIGEGIQNNPLKIKGNKVYFYGAYNITLQKYFSCEELESFCKKNHLNMVPIINNNKFLLDNNVEKLTLLSIGKSIINNSVEREGIVFRLKENECPSPDIENLLGYKKVSFKAINPEYLLINE